jgi:hypothetical protein
LTHEIALKMVHIHSLLYACHNTRDDRRNGPAHEATRNLVKESCRTEVTIESELSQAKTNKVI